MVSLRNVFSKSYFDLKERFGIYVVLSFAVLFALTLILMGNAAFVDSLGIDGNSIYAEIVESGNTGVPYTISSQVISIIASFVIWVLSLFAILLFSSSLVLSSLKFKLKISGRFWMYSTIASISTGIIISWIFKPMYFELLIFSSLLVFSLIYLIVFLIKKRAQFMKILAEIWKKIALIEFVYYIVVLILLSIKVIFVKLTLYSLFQTFLVTLDLILLLIFVHVLFNSITCKKKKISSVVSLVKYSLTNKNSWKVTGIVAAVLLITALFLGLISLIPYTGILILVVVYLEFSLGIVYISRVLLEVNK